jgi:hypothetical protein
MESPCFRPIPDQDRKNEAAILDDCGRERTAGTRCNQPQGSEELASLHCTRLRSGLETQ